MNPVELCEDFASPEASVACPPETLPLIAPVGRFNSPDVLPWTGFDAIFLWIALGAAVAILIGVAIIALVTDQRNAERLDQ